MENSSNELSISMLIDKDIKENTADADINGYIPLPLKRSLNIDERKIYQWVPDDNVTKCNDCRLDFSLMVKVSSSFCFSSLEKLFKTCSAPVELFSGRPIPILILE